MRHSTPSSSSTASSEWLAPHALAYASADIDFAVTQVVDRTKGVHGRIVKDHLVRT
jgi:hypothetical protein